MKTLIAIGSLLTCLVLASANGVHVSITTEPFKNGTVSIECKANGTDLTYMFIHRSSNRTVLIAECVFGYGNTSFLFSALLNDSYNVHRNNDTCILTIYRVSESEYGQYICAQTYNLTVNSTLYIATKDTCTPRSGGGGEDLPFLESGTQSIRASTSITSDQSVTQAIGEAINDGDEPNLPNTCTSVTIEDNFNCQDSETRHSDDNLCGTDKVCAPEAKNGEVEIAQDADINTDTYNGAPVDTTEAVSSETRKQQSRNVIGRVLERTMSKQ